MTPEIERECESLCRRAAEEGIPLFVIHVTPEGQSGYIGLDLSGQLIANMLRAVADALETRANNRTMN